MDQRGGEGGGAARGDGEPPAAQGSGDRRIAYGARCTWWDSIDKVGRRHVEQFAGAGLEGKGTRQRYPLPCCPVCSGMLFEVDSIETWNAGVAKQETTSPGYTALIEWGRGKCYRSIHHLARAFATRQ